MRERWQFNPRMSLLVALLVAAVVDGAIWLSRSGGGTRIRIVRIPVAHRGSSATGSLLSPSGHALLVGAGRHVAYFIMWSRNGRTVAGDMTEELVTPSQDSTFTDTFSGTLRGSRVTLHLPGQGLDGAHSYTARLRTDSLVLDAPGEPHDVIRFRVQRDLAAYTRIVNGMLARQNATAGGGKRR